MNWNESTFPEINPVFQERAIKRQSQLTKPPGSLGKLEDIAIRLATLQQCDHPRIDRISITIFAADHGVVEEHISAFPQEVTRQMVLNFLRGGAAINVLAKNLRANMEVVDVGIARKIETSSLLNPPFHLIEQRCGNGTANSYKQPAMSHQQLKLAFKAGYNSIERALKENTELFIGGEMGIGNTTSATVLYCALLGLPPKQITGAGTGLSNSEIAHKVKVVQHIIEKHKHCNTNALAWLRCTGGFEIAALTGAYIKAAQNGLPVLVDGFISSAAALCAVKIQPLVSNWLFFSHISGEKGHRAAIESLEQTAILDIGMRLGEGSGAAIAVPLMQSACALHNTMATFTEAAVATKL